MRVMRTRGSFPRAAAIRREAEADEPQRPTIRAAMPRGAMQEARRWHGLCTVSVRVGFRPATTAANRRRRSHEEQGRDRQSSRPPGIRHPPDRRAFFLALVGDTAHTVTGLDFWYQFSFVCIGAGVLTALAAAISDSWIISASA